MRVSLLFHQTVQKTDIIAARLEIGIMQQGKLEINIGVHTFHQKLRKRQRIFIIASRLVGANTISFAIIES
jgi:hypothetical protein